MQHVDIYDIYRYCYLGNNTERLYTTYVDGEAKTYKAGFTEREYTPWRYSDGARNTQAYQETIRMLQEDGLLGETPPCVYSRGVSHFLNNATVRDALHIPSGVQSWDMCASNIQYTSAQNGSWWIYPELKDAGIKILFFSGDTDGSVNYLGRKGGD